MGDEWLLKVVRDLVDRVKSLESENSEALAKIEALESEKSEAVAEIEALESENRKMAVLIAEVSAIVAEVSEERPTADILQPTEREELKELTSLAESKVAVDPPSTSTVRERLEKSSADPKKGLRDRVAVRLRWLLHWQKASDKGMAQEPLPQ